MPSFITAVVALLAVTATAAPAPGMIMTHSANTSITASRPQSPLVVKGIMPRMLGDIPDDDLSWMDLLIDPYDTEDTRQSPKGYFAACLNDIFHGESRGGVLGDLTLGRNQDDSWNAFFQNAKKRPHKEGLVQLVPVFGGKWPDSVEIRNAPQPCTDLVLHVSDLFESRTKKEPGRTANPNIDGKGTVRINFVNEVQKRRITKLADAKTFLEHLNVIVKN